MTISISKAKQIFMAEFERLDELVEVLEGGGRILFPTDTIWGVGCDATNPKAVDGIYELKRRDKNKPLVVLVSDIEMLKKYVEHVHPKVETLLSYHQRPLSVIYDKGINLAENLLGPGGSVAIRMVQDELCQEIISRFGRPIVATSANISNFPFPRNFGEISSDILEGVDFVVRHKQGEKDLNNPSVIIKLAPSGELIFLRE